MNASQLSTIGRQREAGNLDQFCSTTQICQLCLKKARPPTCLLLMGTPSLSINRHIIRSTAMVDNTMAGNLDQYCCIL